MPLWVHVEGIKGSLVAHPDGAASEGQSPRYIGLKFVARPADQQGTRDTRKAIEAFDVVRELVEVKRSEHLRIRRAAADGEIRLLGECDAPTRALAEAKLSPVAQPGSTRKNDSRNRSD